MRAKPVLSLIAAVGVLLLTVANAWAVTNSQPDGSGHPYVGLAVFDTASGSAWRCSGALISPTIFLTAGHCTDGAVAARVWFTPDLTGNPDYPAGGPSAIEGVPYTQPEFCVGCGNGLPGFTVNDVGVVVLNTPVTMATYAQLPSQGLVDTLGMGADVDLVGYGVQYKVQASGPPDGRWAGPKIRMYAPAELIAGQFVHSDRFIRLTANPAQDKGGTCFGDSGGPDLLGGTNVVLAVNSYVTNGNCAGVTYSNRIDTASALAFVSSFLTGCGCLPWGVPLP